MNTQAIVRENIRPAEFEIHKCPKTGRPVCGSLTGSPFHLKKMPERFIEWKFKATGRDIKCDSKGHDEHGYSLEGCTARYKAQAKLYFDLVGPKFNRRWFAWNARYFIYDALPKDSWDLLRTSRSSFSGERVEEAHKVKDLLWQAEKDGQINIMPFIILFQMNPKDLKSLFGRSEWKKLASNSKTRNRNIFLAMFRAKNCLIIDYGETESSSMIDKLRCATINLNKVQSSAVLALTKDSGMGLLDYDYVLSSRNSPKLSRDKISGHLRLFSETRIILQREGRTCRPEWSHRRLRREHDEGVRRMNKIQISRHDNNPFCDPFSFTQGEFTGELLVSKREIAIEAQDQRHCVLMYAGRADAGSYAVFRISGPERATCGLYMKSEDPVSWLLDQVTGFYNAPVKTETHDFCDALLEVWEQECRVRAADRKYK